MQSQAPLKVQPSAPLQGVIFVFLLAILTITLVACGDTPSPQGATPGPTLERSRGETLFIRYCNGCHPGGGMGGGPSLKNLPLPREDVVAYITHGKGRMPGFGDTFSEDEMKDLVDYVLALR